MRKWAVAMSIVLLLLSLFFLTSYKTSYTAVKAQSGIANATGTPDLSVWEWTGNFSANDTILVDILPNIFWSSNASAFDTTDNNVPVMYIDIDIMDPTNSTSKYETWWTYRPEDGNRRLTVFNATVLSVGEGIDRTVHLAPDFVNPVTFIAGMAKIDGIYLANLTFAGSVIDYRSDGRFRPGAFALYYARALMQESQPYMSLLYVSFATIPAGVILLIYGLKTDKKRKRKV